MHSIRSLKLWYKGQQVEFVIIHDGMWHPGKNVTVWWPVAPPISLKPPACLMNDFMDLTFVPCICILPVWGKIIRRLPCVSVQKPCISSAFSNSPHMIDTGKIIIQFKSCLVTDALWHVFDSASVFERFTFCCFGLNSVSQACLVENARLSLADTSWPRAVQTEFWILYSKQIF